MRRSGPKRRWSVHADGVSLFVFFAVAICVWAGDERRAGPDWWSLQPLRPVAVPRVDVGRTPINPIDHFLLHRLQKEGLGPSPEVDRNTLIRRLSFDLLGLPPEPHEVEAFV